jgi:hypothetical protein
VNKKVQGLQDTLEALNGLLGWGFLSPATREQLEMFKADIEAELRFILSQQSDVAAAG